ncbi:MAG: hypothetical protein P4L44_07985 [Oryzomonas sp.]|uniref:hypothetical protein n=1 Tax=Oryzomonas sp. TaxID=2855186 RepID=UPI0028506921|nr:hypothetical protein [Oryzomonas sp.]MDR3579883.1 hypothetical protein [Oryzomonas sp.]
MQKSMWLMVVVLFSMFISGCGGGTSTSIIASTPTALTPSDVSGKVLYSTPINSIKGYVAFQTSSGGSAAWDSQANRKPTPIADVHGTWAISNGQLVLSVAGTPSYQFTCIQKESNYWLVSDGHNTITRMYSDQAAAENYLDSITAANGTNVKLAGAIQGTPLTMPFSNVSTVAGVTGTSGVNIFSDYSTAKSPPSLFGRPIGITTMDGTTFFVLDNANNNIVKLTPGTNGIMTATTLKTSGGVIIPFNYPSDITTDGTNLYVTDTYNYVIKKISPDNHGAWISATLSGTGASGSFDGTGNTLSATGVVVTTGTARFAAPIGITTDGTNLYVTDNYAIRKVDIATGNTTTLAGSPGAAGSIDATGTAARFNVPLRITTDGTNLYVTDNSNYTIRKVSIATGQVTTIAGSPGNLGTNITPSVPTGDKALFNGPNGITTDGTNLYVTDWGPVIYGGPARGQVVFSIVLNPTGQYSGPVTRIAGTQDTIAPVNGPNQPTPLSPNQALFNCPIGITTDGTGLYVADSLNYTIRRIK